MKKYIFAAILFMFAVDLSAQTVLADSIISYGGMSIDGIIDMNTHKINNLDTAVLPNQAVPLWQIRDSIGGAAYWQGSVTGGRIWPYTLTDSVGIGTASPTEIFEVSGNSVLDGDVNVGGSINIGEGEAYLYDGAQALKLAKGTDTFYANTYVGAGAGSGTQSQTVIGYLSGSGNTSVRQTAVGNTAGYQNTGDQQTTVGYRSGYLNSGDWQTSFGTFSGYQNTGDIVLGFGYDASRNNTGDNIIALGYQAGRNNTGNDVIAIGYQAGKDNTVDNQFILQQVNVNAVPLIQGDFASGNVGIGITTPGYLLEVDGTTETDTLTINGTTDFYETSSGHSQMDGTSINFNTTFDLNTTQAVDTIETVLTDSDTKLPTSGAVVDYAAPIADSSLWERSGAYVYPKTLTDRVGIGTATPTTMLDVSGRIAVTGTGNTIMIGEGAGAVDDYTSNNNVYIGKDAGLLSQTAYGNIGIGTSTLKSVVGAGDDYNVAIGVECLTLTTGSESVAIGRQTLAQATGSGNTAVGYLSMSGVTNGLSNVAVGNRAGNNTNAAATNTSPDNCTYIGDDTRAFSASSDYETVIGAKAKGNGSNTVTLGDDNVTDVYMAEDAGATVHALGINLNTLSITENTDEGALQVTSDILGVTNQIGLEDWTRVYNNSGHSITNGQVCYLTGVYLDDTPTIDTASNITLAKANLAIGVATSTIDNGNYGFITLRGKVRGINTASLSTVGYVYLGVEGGLTMTKPSWPSGVVVIGVCIYADATDGILLVDLSREMQGAQITKSYSFTSNGVGAGSYYNAGFYHAPVTDANLTQASTTQTYGTANGAYSAHAFVVCGGVGATDAGVVGLRVTGTSITDAGVRTTSDADTIITDITAVATNEYYEAKKFIGIVTFELITMSGAPTTYSLDFNYGLSKYEDFGNQDFTIVGIESVGVAGATDANFDVILYHHSNIGWTYSATAFVPASDVITSLKTLLSTESSLINTQPFSFKKFGINEPIIGTGQEGLIIKIICGQNSSVQSMNSHLGVVIN